MSNSDCNVIMALFRPRREVLLDKTASHDAANSELDLDSLGVVVKLIYVSHKLDFGDTNSCDRDVVPVMV